MFSNICNTHELWVITVLRGYYIHNQKLARVVLYLKITNVLLKSNTCILEQ